MDDQGYTVAQLHPGDRVSMMDDGRIVVNDVEGKTVSRLVDETAASVFFTPVTTAQPPNPTDPSSADATNGADHQSDNYLNVIDIPAPALANQFAGGNLGGAYGAGQLMGFDVLPFNKDSSFLTNTDGDIVGEINVLPNGYHQIKNLYGETAYVASSGQVLSEQQYEQAQYSQAAGAIGLMNSIIGLQNWDDMGDLQRLAAVTSIYNAFDKLTGGGLPLGDLGTAAGVLGLLSALDQGNMGGALYSGLSLVENLTSVAGVANSGWVSLNMPGGADFLPGLGLVLALDSGDPVAILAAAVNFIPGWGQIASVVITLLGGLFADDDQPMLEGRAHAEWDGAGNTIVLTDQDSEGGGATAAGWMSSLVNGLQAQLAATKDAAGNSYALVPNLLPAIGYQYDPDGFNLANGAKGFLYLQWTDESGATQTRYYDGQGSRGDGSGETLAGDFMAHAQGAIAPAWQVQTTLAHWQQGQGINLPDSASGLPQEQSDGIHQSLQALSLTLPQLPPLQNALIDIDGDGYLERTQWLATNQQVLAIDSNGDGNIGAGELLSLNGGNALNSLSWLDADGNKILNASDPAFAALRLWMDVNADGQGNGETSTLAQAGITAIDFGSNPPSIVRGDGSRSTLTAQTLTGDILGVSYQSVTGGVLQLDEQRNAAAIATLHAVNTREFDGQAGHMHGGDVDTDGADGATITVQAGDSRLSTTSANTFTTGAFKSTQTSTSLGAGDARVQAGAAGQAVTGQGAVHAAGNALVRSTPLAFVPLGAASLQAEVKQATYAMVRSATPALFEPASGALVAMALGAGAVQWPSLASANAPADPSQAPFAQPPASAPASADAINWQALDGSRVSVAALDALTPSSGSTANGASLAGGLPTAVAAGTYESNQTPAHTEWAQAAIDSVAVEVPVASASPGSSSAQSGLSDAAATNWSSASSAAGSNTLIDYPRVQGEKSEATEDTVRRFSEAWLLANDSTVNAPAWPDQPSLRITSVFAPVHGSVSLQTDASGATELVFVPDANYHGPASFSYTVTDQYGLSSTASVSLQVAAVNDAPVATGETANGDEDHTLQFTAASLLVNDFDVDSAVDGDVLRITRVGSAQHGQVFLAADGTVSFIPDANYNGPAQFTYWVGDRDPAQIAANGAGEGYETPATVNLTVLPVNDLPVVTGEVMDSDEDIVLLINPALLLANDTDVDTAPTNDGNAEPAQVLRITAVSGAQHGSIALLADGTLQFTPERNYFGAAGFSYTVDDGNGGQVVGQVVVNLAPVNDAPDVVGETVSFNEDEIQTITQASLLANDSDVDNPQTDLRIVAVDNATHGAVSLNPDGSIRFAPAHDYYGPAQFTYTVSDGVGGFTVGTASLDIAPVNDAPRLLGESLTLDEDTEAHFSIPSLLANDHDVDNLHSELSITAVAMDPASSAAGTVQIVAGEIVFTPMLNFNGGASFTYTVADGVGGSSQATVNLNFTPVNDAPVANSELIWGKRDVSYTLSQAALLANDADVESPNNLQISAISNVQHGTAVLNADGSVSFTPEAGYAGRGSFDYLVRDPDGATSTATAQIDFSRININPLATDDSFTGYEDVVFSITQAQLLVNDSDADNPAADLRVTAVAGAQNGSVSLDVNGTVRFTPAANFYGTATFTYQVSDGEGGSTWAMAQLSVQSVNDAPIIEDIWYGRPIYGTASQVVGYDESGAAVYGNVQVTSESQARALLAGGQLQGHSGSFYQNGQLRPVGFDSADAGAADESGPYDDPYRQNGAVIAFDPDGNSALLGFSVGSTPQHGHAWANQYTASNAPGSIDHTQAEAYWAGQTGAWQYYSHRGDGYAGGDPFTITVTDSGGASANASVNTAHVGSSIGGGGGKKPVSLDLNGNGLQYIGLDDSQAYFDVNNDGWRERIAWVAADDGLLVRDIGADGKIERYDEISFTSYLTGAKTDLEGLTAFDSNHDGVLSRLDTRWKEFAVWRDTNNDGVSDVGEVITLDDIGIAQIGLASDHQTRMVDGVTEHGQAQFVWDEQHGGHTGAVGDVSLPFDANDRLPAVAAQSLARAVTPDHVETPVVAVAEARVEKVPAPAVMDALARMAAIEALDALDDYEMLPRPEPVVLPPIPPADGPTPMQMALVMLQAINALTADRDAPPLVFVPLGGVQEPASALTQAQDQWEQAATTAPLHGGSS
ncbi:cadherin-like domain-containing protein [Polaromonas sp.]|uniref:cadherin-like domain-containing protein n=1 Tax=Polaromonas sp. TaxID=1869339 RepID=UPI003751A421